jgi:hypothetical protein
MLRPGHDGPHEWTRDDVINREFARPLVATRKKVWRSQLVPGIKGRSYCREEPPYEGLSVEDVDLLIDEINRAFRVRMRRLRAFKGYPEEFLKHALKKRDFSFGRVTQQYLERKKERTKGSGGKTTAEKYERRLADYAASRLPDGPYSRERETPNISAGSILAELKRARRWKARMDEN